MTGFAYPGSAGGFDYGTGGFGYGMSDFWLSANELRIRRRASLRRRRLRHASPYMNPLFGAGTDCPWSSEFPDRVQPAGSRSARGGSPCQRSQRLATAAGKMSHRPVHTGEHCLIRKVGEMLPDFMKQALTSGGGELVRAFFRSSRKFRSASILPVSLDARLGHRDTCRRGLPAAATGLFIVSLSTSGRTREGSSASRRR